MYRYCFTTADAEPLSDIPSTESAFFWRWNPMAGWRGRKGLRAATRLEALTHEFTPKLQHLPLSNCIDRCSERGGCLAAVAPQRASPRRVSAACRCDSYYFGKTCHRHSSPHCWNGCSGRGECVDGFCVCRGGSYGPACALGGGGGGGGGSGGGSGSGGGGGGGGGGGRRPTVYVYDLPPVVLRRRAFASDRDPIFNTHHAFLEALLADAPSLARSPAEAALFLVPAFATNMEALREYYSHAQRHVATHHPWWTASGGANHLWWSTADGGGCELNQLRETRHSVAVAHYIKANRSGGYRRTNERCGVASKDVAAPPKLPFATEERLLRAGRRPLAARALRFFFAGNVPDSHLPGFDQRTDDDLGREAYSEGVRQLVWKHLRKADGFKVVARSPSYEDDWADARVCLAPLGVGWGIRLLWSVLAGCVPLLASSEVSPWFDRVLPWEGMRCSAWTSASCRACLRSSPASPRRRSSKSKRRSGTTAARCCGRRPASLTT